ncbi:MAG: chorismate synthase, partial [Clostridiales bacterium 43-6]
HGEAIGVTLDGIPAGIPLDFEQILYQMKRRAPGNHSSATPRKEADIPRVLSGVLDGVTTGAPMCAVIENTNTRSVDYKNISDVLRPSHADYTALARYKGYSDKRGGGHFSGRLTAPLVFAGSVCRQILQRHGIFIGGHLYAVGGIYDTAIDPMNVDMTELKTLSGEIIAVRDHNKKTEIEQKLEAARMTHDSVGGIVEVAVTGLPAGIGSPMFYGVEGVLSSYLYAIPAVKAVEFGDGFGISSLLGSEANDAYTLDKETVKTVTNHCGGILGGITSGMPLIVRAGFKPTPSIAKPQKSVNIKTMEETTLEIVGRHDPCVVPRALPCVEAAVAVALCELLADSGFTL